MKCFEHNKEFNKTCRKKACRYWIESKGSKNCAILASKSKEKLTLEDVGKLFNVTRMRICQIEKIAIKKLREKVSSIIK